MIAGPVLFIGLNPSTADDASDDATIRKERGYVRVWGVPEVRPAIDYRSCEDAPRRRYLLTRPGMIKANLFSLRSTDPRGLLVDPDHNDVDNMVAIIDAAGVAGTIVACWGGPYAPKRLGLCVAARAAKVVTSLSALGFKLHYLQLSMGGIPRHVLYLPGSLRPTLGWDAT